MSFWDGLISSFGMVFFATMFAREYSLRVFSALYCRKFKASLDLLCISCDYSISRKTIAYRLAKEANLEDVDFEIYGDYFEVSAVKAAKAKWPNVFSVWHSIEPCEVEVSNLDNATISLFKKIKDEIEFHKLKKA